MCREHRDSPGLAGDGGVPRHGVAAGRPPSSLMIRCIATAAGQEGRSGMELRKYGRGIAQVLSIVTARRDVLGRLKRKAKRASGGFARTVLKIYCQPQTFISTWLCLILSCVYK